MPITSTSLLSTLAVAALLLQPAAATAQARSEANTPRTATGSSASSAARSAARPAAARPWSDQDYRLGPGDKLRVEVYRQDQMSQSLQVRPDGKITLPQVGDVQAAGLTPTELRDRLTESLKEYIINPAVTVIVQEATSAQVHVIGEVANPGTLVMQGPMTILQALARAGGLSEFANRRRIHVLRVNGDRSESLPFDYKKALEGDAQPMYLQPGDTLVVP